MMDSYTRRFEVATLDLDASAHAAGDTLFVGVAVAACSRTFRRNNNNPVLRSLTYSISAAQDVSPVIYIFSANPTLGAANAAFGLTFADSSKILGRLVGGTAVAVGAGRQWVFPDASSGNLYVPLLSDDDTNIYIAAATAGTPTPGASCTSKLIMTVEYN